MRNLISLAALCALAAGCSSTDPEPPRSREEFCRDFAQAACSEEAVSACQSDAERCHLAQQTLCQSLVPAEFSDVQGDACIAAVSAAYADAELTGDELMTVLHLGPPCDAVVHGPQARIAAKDIGEFCTNNVECGPDARCSADATCVARLGIGICCSENDDCKSNLCYRLGESNACVDRIRLSPAEPICENLR